jgi:hypothetical protein
MASEWGLQGHHQRTALVGSTKSLGVYHQRLPTNLLTWQESQDGIGVGLAGPKEQLDQLAAVEEQGQKGREGQDDEGVHHGIVDPTRYRKAREALGLSRTIYNRF